jgi:hypothetical protein
MTKLIVNCETNEVTERELNDQEVAQQITDEAYIAEKLQPIIAEAEAKATQKAALLDRLGITEDEAKLLLG